MPTKDAYDRGRMKLDRRRNAGDVREALNDFERALELNPGHAQAWLGKADAHILLIGYGGSLDPIRDLEEAATALARADQSSDKSADYYYVQGRVQLYKDRDVQGARASLAQAVEMDPHNLPALHTLANVCSFLGQHQEAETLCRKALDIIFEHGEGKDDRRFLLSKIFLAWTYFYAGEYDLAKAQCDQILDVDPAHSQASRFLSLIYLQKGDYAEALKRYRAADADRNADHNLFAHYTCALALSGQSVEARNNLETLLTYADYVSPCRLAQCYATLGEADKALDQLRRARDDHDLFVLWSAIDPLLSSLKENAEFRDYLCSIGLGDAIIP